MDGRWRLVAGCFSTHIDTNSQTAQAWDVPSTHLYQDWQTMLVAERDRLDAVAILTPTPSHADIVIKALELGYPVICEKALATTSAEAERIKAAVDQLRGFLAVTYNYTGYPMLRELRDIILTGGLGKLHQIHIEMPQEGFSRLGKDGTNPKPQSWRRQDGAIPTLSLDLGVHLHHIIDFLSNEKPTELVALNNSYGLIDGIVDNTMCIANYTNDLHCQLWFGKTALGHRNGLRVRVYGSSGSAEWYQMEPEILTRFDNQGRINRYERACAELRIADDLRYNRFKAGHPGGFLEAFANHYYDIADCLIEYQKTGCYASPWVFSADTAEQGLIMLETIAESARKKTWLPVVRPTRCAGQPA